MPGETALTPKQARFVQEYLIDLNGTQAAIRAGYSPKTAQEIASQNLSKPMIAEAVAVAQAQRAERVGFTGDEVLRELGHLVRSRVTHFVEDETGKIALAEGAPAEAWAAVSSLKTKTRYIPRKDEEDTVEREVEFRLWDKNSAIDKAMRHLGLLKDGVDTGKRVMRVVFVDEGNTKGVEIIEGE